MNMVLTITDLHMVADEPRVLDLRIAERLGYENPNDIRELIERNTEELTSYGEIFRMVRKNSGRGRPATECWLNEAQTLLLCMFSKTENAALVRKEVIEVYLAYRQNRLPRMEPLSTKNTIINVRLEDYADITASLAAALSAQHELMQIKRKGWSSKHAEAVRLMINETELNDYEIAGKMQSMLGEYMPEWVAFYRRKLIEESASSH